MMDTDVPLGAVLVGLDESAESARALSWAATEARRRHWPLHLMHVLDESEWAWPVATTARPMEPVVRDALSMLDDWSHELSLTWSQPVGDAAALLAAGSRAARLTVVGSGGRGAVAEAFLGSVTTRLIAQTRCPVAVLRSDTPIPRPDAPVVVGLEYGRPCVPTLEAAFEQASSRHVDLVIVHTWQVDASTVVDELELQGLPTAEAQAHETALLKRTIADIARRHPDVEITRHAVQDGAADTLRRYAADAALLVVGSRGRGEVTGAVLGSVSQSVIRRATCPVLVVRDERKPVVPPSSRTAAGASS